ncbi:histidine triad nucleotide-binding protein 3-like [Anneissia japonica]|uniref:histidine triad nucleotide-binding protein 3-like n=1 Tax=Anneissia japonica TaxID=1529436 RepID=UPI0014255453|nr:histidine triad nucleotide-binding protein 3-like [Anneissia japonica]
MSENRNVDDDNDEFDKYSPEHRSSATAGSSLTNPRDVVFDEDHTPVTRGGAYEILIKKSCVFCKIAHEEEGRLFAKPVFQNTEVTVFSDISPAAKVHLLVIPNSHISNTRQLKKEHVPLLEYMFASGAGGLEILGGSINEARVGFHCPPFTSMDHLHMHILYPETSIRWLNKLFFRPDSYWFTLYDTMLKSLHNMEGPDVKSVSFPSFTRSDPEESSSRGESEAITPKVVVENEKQDTGKEVNLNNSSKENTEELQNGE